KDGWFYLGDIGTMDEDGYLTIVDRKSDMIIAGGFNIYPQEIDEILMSHHQILEACSIGVSDKYRGETVKAYVVLKPDQTLSEKEIVDYCRENLAAYKTPRAIVFIDELPKTAVGKILRREIKRIDQEQAQKASKK
ncbi:MAG: long-chain fatty acid--CoA ligase, partial [Desulfobacula sp.]|nr:long-chain fatty acid--CoA ligase [Desulfobacula sp.]